METSISSDLIRGHIDTIILKLVSRKNMYGYLIMKEISIQTSKAYELKEATLYSSLKRLEKDGLVDAYWGEQDLGARRKYYAINEKGRKQLNENLILWQQAKKIIDTLLEGASNE